MLPYQDPKHPGNSLQHRSGKPCIDRGCTEPAGTLWSPLLCFRHNVERLDRITVNLEAVAAEYGVSKS